MHKFPAFVIAVMLVLTAGCPSSDYNARVFLPWGCDNAKDFKARLDNYKHIFMVCIYENSWEDQGPNRYSLHHSKGRVVRSYKGDWRISERVAFVQGFDYRALTTTSNKNAGSLGFIFTNQHADTEIVLDTGDFSWYEQSMRPRWRAYIQERPVDDVDSELNHRGKRRMAHQDLFSPILINVTI
jgi:hypothetical protein